MPGSDTVFVVIPVLNEARTISDIVARTRVYADNIIVVDDGSTDGTADILYTLPVKVLRHDRNRGKGASLMTGFRAALQRGASAVITLDGDGQHKPEDIPRFIACAERSPRTMIIGDRLTDRAAFPVSRYRANRVANFWISWACGYRIDDSQCGFRLYPREVLEATRACDSRQSGFAFESEILIDAARCGFRSTAIPISAIYLGAAGRRSHFRPLGHITTIVVMVAWKLISRGMYPQGLLRSLRDRRASPHG